MRAPYRALAAIFAIAAPLVLAPHFAGAATPSLFPKARVGEKIRYTVVVTTSAFGAPHQDRNYDSFTVLAASPGKLTLRHHSVDGSLRYTTHISFGSDGIFRRGSASSHALLPFLAARVYVGPHPGALEPHASWTFEEPSTSIFDQPGPRRFRVDRIDGPLIYATLSGSGEGLLGSVTGRPTMTLSGQKAIEKDRFRASLEFRNGILVHMHLTLLTSQQQPSGKMNDYVLSETATAAFSKVAI